MTKIKNDTYMIFDYKLNGIFIVKKNFKPLKK